MKRIYFKEFILKPMFTYFWSLILKLYVHLFSKPIRYFSSNSKFTLSKAHDSDACYDLQSSQSYVLGINERALISTGVYLELPKNWEAQIRPRSGNALKYGLTILNTPGTIDSGYRDEVKVLLWNTGYKSVEIEPGDRIAQIKFDKVPRTKLKKVNFINFSTDRGQKGFGSSGK